MNGSFDFKIPSVYMAAAILTAIPKARICVPKRPNMYLGARAKFEFLIRIPNEFNQVFKDVREQYVHHTHFVRLDLFLDALDRVKQVMNAREGDWR